MGAGRWGQSYSQPEELRDWDWSAGQVRTRSHAGCCCCCSHRCSSDGDKRAEEVVFLRELRVSGGVGQTHTDSVQSRNKLKSLLSQDLQVKTLFSILGAPVFYSH